MKKEILLKLQNRKRLIIFASLSWGIKTNANEVTGTGKKGRLQRTFCLQYGQEQSTNIISKGNICIEV